MANPLSHIVEASLARLLDGGPGAVSLCAALALPAVAGVPLTVTDAYRLASGRILLSAVAEATADTYADGALTGAAIIELDADFRVLAVQLLDPPLKVEGIAARTAGDRLHLLCVTDADDPGQPSALYEGVWETGP